MAPNEYFSFNLIELRVNCHKKFIIIKIYFYNIIKMKNNFH